MEEETKDQVQDEVVEEKDDQASKEQSEETEEEPTVADAIELAKNTQKGISQYIFNTNKDITEVKEQMQGLADSINKKTGSESGDDDYLTVSGLKKILSDQAQQQEQSVKQADSYIEKTMVQLKAEGVVKNDAEGDDLMKFAIAKKETDLLKAASYWQDVKKARMEAKKESAKTKTKQEEGSQIGTSSKQTTESSGIDYMKMKQWERENM